MCALIEKMVNLNRSKKGWTKSATNSSSNEKILKSAIQFFISKSAAA